MELDKLFDPFLVREIYGDDLDVVTFYHEFPFCRLYGVSQKLSINYRAANYRAARYAAAALFSPSFHETVALNPRRRSDLDGEK